MRPIFLILALLLCLCLCPVARAERETPEPEVFTNGDYTYILLEDGTAEITKYRGTVEDLVIPESLNSVPVTGIGDHAFSMRFNLTSVTIPDGVTTIGHSAFYRCPDLTVTVGHDSYAEKYCQDTGIQYIYSDSNDWLNNYDRDV